MSTPTQHGHHCSPCLLSNLAFFLHVANFSRSKKGIKPICAEIVVQRVSRNDTANLSAFFKKVLKRFADSNEKANTSQKASHKRNDSYGRFTCPIPNKIGEHEKYDRGGKKDKKSEPMSSFVRADAAITNKGAILTTDAVRSSYFDSLLTWHSEKVSIALPNFITKEKWICLA
jgi:hypothetical protein